jgi:hypothetical protein
MQQTSAAWQDGAMLASHAQCPDNWRSRGSGLLPLFVLLASTVLGASPETASFPIPQIVLDSRLERVLVVSECKRISGLTCRIAYSGKDSLPSRVFFTERNLEGKPLGARVQLIYPKLRAGGKGWATFRLRSSNPASIHLTGEWKGPWRDPY